MFDPTNESSFRLDVAGLSAPFEVLAFTGNEALSEPFAFEVDVLVEDAHLDLASLLHRSAFLCFGAAHEGVHGQLQSLLQHEHGSSSRLCRVQLGPKLSCLALRFSQRIFSGQSVVQMLDQVLKEHGITGAQRRFDCCAEHSPGTFCTQYCESDLQFLQRLCAQARLHYYFEHRRDGHCLVFGDDPAGLPTTAVARFAVAGEEAVPAVRQWQLQDKVQHAPATAPLRTAQGQTHLAGLRSGQWLPLTGHPLAECNRRWLLTRVEHHADQLMEPVYSNQIFALEQASALAPTAASSRRRMHSLQRAWVVEVDEPRPDHSRPVAVQFDWLYQGEGAAPSHCWLPLAPALQQAPSAILGEGVEVVVSFLEGDPDQPIISGILQNPVASLDEEYQPPSPVSPMSLSDNTRRLLQSAEPLLLLCLIPGGGSFNHCAHSVCTCRLVTALEQSGGQ